MKNIILTKEMNLILLFLAKRNNNEIKEWSIWKFPSRSLNDIEGTISICLICNNEISIYNRSEHGFMHLREHNLLPFL